MYRNVLHNPIWFANLPHEVCGLDLEWADLKNIRSATDKSETVVYARKPLPAGCRPCRSLTANTGYTHSGNQPL